MLELVKLDILHVLSTFTIVFSVLLLLWASTLMCCKSLCLLCLCKTHLHAWNKQTVSIFICTLVSK